MEFDIRKKYPNYSVLIGITITVVFIIFCIVSISRKSMEVKAEENTEVFSAHSMFDFSGDYNVMELQVLNLLGSAPVITNNTGTGKENAWSLKHLNFYADYFNRSDLILSTSDVEKIAELIRGEQEILQYETEQDMKKISFDGRKFVLYSYEEIYKLCGLHIAFDSEYNIGKITEQTGSVIYQSTVVNNQVLHPEALFITLFLIITLTTLCFIIAKKNQLFNKGGSYDGFDEKEYA